MDNKSRRDFLKNSGLGVGGAALAGLAARRRAGRRWLALYPG